MTVAGECRNVFHRPPGLRTRDQEVIPNDTEFTFATLDTHLVTEPASRISVDFAGAQAQLERQLPEITLDGTGFGDVIEFLRDVSGANIFVNIASSAGATPISATAPDARAVTAAISGRLRSALFATGIRSWCAPDASGRCAPDTTQHCPSTPAQVQAADGPRVVVVCVSEADPPACTTPPPVHAAPYPAGCGDSPTITVRVVGFVASFVPPGFGPGAGAFELPTNISATTHTLRFAP